MEDSNRVPDLNDDLGLVGPRIKDVDVEIAFRSQIPKKTNPSEDDRWMPWTVLADGPGPFPALVMAPGHGAGKESQYAWASTLARRGVLVLAIDPPVPAVSVQPDVSLANWGLVISCAWSPSPK